MDGGAGIPEYATGGCRAAGSSLGEIFEPSADLLVSLMVHLTEVCGGDPSVGVVGSRGCISDGFCELKTEICEHYDNSESNLEPNGYNVYHTRVTVYSQNY